MCWKKMDQQPNVKTMKYFKRQREGMKLFIHVYSTNELFIVPIFICVYIRSYIIASRVALVLSLLLRHVHSNAKTKLFLL